MKDSQALREIETELALAREKYAPLSSAHEGFNVILERLDNLWLEVKKPALLRKPETLKVEAARLGAMAVRFMTDCL
jgi:hypothetical protein